MKASDHLRIIQVSDGAGQSACKRDEILAYTAHSGDWRLARSWLLQELGRHPAHDSRDLSDIDSRSSSFT